VDASGAGFDLHEAAAARDALLAFGSSQGGQGVLVASSENTFDDLIDGLSLTVKGSSTDPVSIDVGTTDADVVSAAKTFVEQYNALAKKVEEFTFFNAVDETVGVLFGSNEALRLESDLASMVTGRFFGAGSIQSLAEVGINVKDDGTLELNQEKLQTRFAADPAAVEEFFTAETTGFADKFDRLIETLAGEGSSLLVDRSAALTRKVELNQERIEFFDGRLERERTLLLRQFYGMEEAIGKLQLNMNAIAAIQPLPPLTLSNSNQT
jgi:flagellar hook-associated protein 2